jgi:uncharacterized protein YkwD
LLATVAEVYTTMNQRLLIVLVLGWCLLTAAATGQAVAKDEVESKTISTTKPTQGSASPELANTVQDIISRTNSFRQAEGLREVESSPQLMEAARDFAQFMASTDKYGHAADGRHPADRAKQHGYDYCIIAENIAYQHRTSGFTSEELAREFFQGWKESPDHRKNMLNSAVTETGVAVAQSEKTGYYYAVQMFGRPQTETIEFQVTNRTDTLIPYAIEDQTLSLPPRATRTHQQCRLVEITFQWPGKQERTTVQPQPGDHYTIVQDDAGAFRLQKD